MMSSRGDDGRRTPDEGGMASYGSEELMSLGVILMTGFGLLGLVFLLLVGSQESPGLSRELSPVLGELGKE